jgi:hypothetical protein
MEGPRPELVVLDASGRRAGERRTSDLKPDDAIYLPQGEWELRFTSGYRAARLKLEGGNDAKVSLEAGDEPPPPERSGGAGTPR